MIRSTAGSGASALLIDADARAIRKASDAGNNRLMLHA
jgi:hypothetical protein